MAGPTDGITAAAAPQMPGAVELPGAGERSDARKVGIVEDPRPGYDGQEWGIIEEIGRSFTGKDGGPPMDRGVVVSYDEDRGFGFIRTRKSRADVFVHVRDVAGGGPLKVGQRVEFAAEPGAEGPRAVKVKAGRQGLPPVGSTAVGLVVALAVATLGFRRLGLPWPAAWLASINPLTILAYARDKQQARRNARRLPEWVLLILALVGGWPAAALGMALLGHKTRKTSFRIAFAGVVALNLMVLGAWYWYGRG